MYICRKCYSWAESFHFGVENWKAVKFRTIFGRPMCFNLLSSSWCEGLVDSSKHLSDDKKNPKKLQPHPFPQTFSPSGWSQVEIHRTPWNGLKFNWFLVFHHQNGSPQLKTKICDWYTQILHHKYHTKQLQKLRHWLFQRFHPRNHVYQQNLRKFSWFAIL